MITAGTHGPHKCTSKLTGWEHGLSVEFIKLPPDPKTNPFYERMQARVTVVFQDLEHTTSKVAQQKLAEAVDVIVSQIDSRLLMQRLKAARRIGKKKRRIKLL